MKKILLWNMNKKGDDPLRLEIDDGLASACVRASVATPVDPAEAGPLAIGPVLSADNPTLIVLWTGAFKQSVRALLPWSVAEYAVKNGHGALLVGSVSIDARPPPGFVFLIDTDGAILGDTDGARSIEPA